jgi:SHS2 domain-containing protein
VFPPSPGRVARGAGQHERTWPVWLAPYSGDIRTVPGGFCGLRRLAEHGNVAGGHSCAPTHSPLMATTYWEHFPHEADMGVRGVGTTKSEAFEQAAFAMTAVVVDPADVAARELVTIECEAPDDELLFAQWLNSLIYEMSTRRMLFSEFAVHLDGTRLHGKAWGERIDPARHHPAVEIKGATYTTLRVAHEHDQWIAQTVVDV